MFNRDGLKFMHLPENSMLNDYTLLFNLKSNIWFKAFSPEFVSDK